MKKSILPHENPNNISAAVEGFYGSNIPPYKSSGTLYNYNDFRMSAAVDETFAASGSPVYTSEESYEAVIGIVRSSTTISYQNTPTPLFLGTVISRPLLEFFYHA